MIDLDVEAVSAEVVRAREAVRRAAEEGDSAELYEILAAGYAAAVFVFRREPELRPIAGTLRCLLKRGDPANRRRRSH